MVLPLAVAIIGGTYLIKRGDEIIEATKDEYDEAINQGAVIVESFADLIGDLGESIAEGTLGAIRGAGVAIMDASQATYSYISSKVADRRV